MHTLSVSSCVRAAPPDATRPWRRSGAQPSELADLAETAATDAERLLTNAKHALRRARAKATARKTQGEHAGAAGRRRGRLAPPSTTPVDLVTATRKITAQTRQRLAGQTPDGSTRRVSLHDPDARPIAKGRLGKPVEFGHKAQLVEGDDGVIVDHNVERGNPADAPQLAPAVDRVRTRAGRPPRRSPPTAATARKPSKTTSATSACATWRSPAKANPQLAGEPRNTDQHSDERSGGTKESMEESAPSNADTAGTAPALTAPKAPRSGSATGSWRTTWSRSAPWQREGRGSGGLAADPIPTGRPAENSRIMLTKAPRFSGRSS